MPLCSYGGGRFGQSLTAIAKLVPDAEIEEGLAISYSGGSEMADDIFKWLKENGIEANLSACKAGSNSPIVPVTRAPVTQETIQMPAPRSIVV